MTHAEIIASAREIVAAQNDNNFERVDNRSWKYGLDMAVELIRLHDGGEWSSEPPKESRPHWWKPTLESSPRMFHVYQETEITNSRCREYRVDGYVVLQGSKGSVTDPYVFDMGGFWLRAEPATATMLAELRAENERLKQEQDNSGFIPWRSAQDNIDTLISDRDRLALEVKRLNDLLTSERLK